MRGRPKKTLDNLLKNWKKILLDIKKEGGSDVEVRVALDISVDLWDRFKEEIPEFSETVKKGQDLCEAWWLGKGRELENRKLNTVLWYMNMKNRFGWKDKNELTGEGGKDFIVKIINYGAHDPIQLDARKTSTPDSPKHSEI